MSGYNIRIRVTDTSEIVISDCFLTNQTVEAIESLSQLLISNLKDYNARLTGEGVKHATTKKTH